jgi:hypothetical protein
MFTVSWLKDAAERAIKTFAQSALATLGLGTLDVLTVNWVGVVSIGAGAALISVLTSVASEPVGVGGTASLTKAVEPTQ